MGRQQQAIIDTDGLREFIVEGRAIQARIGERRTLLTIVPGDLDRSIGTWEAKASAALASRPELLAQFKAEPARNPFAVQTAARVAYDQLEQRLNVLEAIARA